MKRILVLGGAGTMGLEVVQQLVKRTSARVTIADASEKALKKVQAELGDRAELEHINVEDQVTLVALMKASHVVVNAAGPFYKTAARVIKAAIEARVNLVDIDDDFDATRDSLALDEEAKQAGITVIIGMGASPGITNLIAKYGADKLDKVEDIRIYWAESAIDPTGPAAMAHWFHITSGKVPIYRNGKWSEVQGFTEPEEVDFIAPIGKLNVVYTGHPEPVSLPRYIYGVKNVSIKGTLYPPRIMELYQTLIDAGCGSLDQFIVTDKISLPVREFAVRLVRAMPRFAPSYFGDILHDSLDKYKGVAGAFKIDVAGKQAGENVRYVYDIASDSVTRGTATPAAIATLMLLEEKVTATGVMAPEGALDASMFYTELASEARTREIEIRERAFSKNFFRRRA